jgi:type IV pilus assembly protein PilN
LKPIHLNLASRPYRDYRPVYAVVVGASLLAAFLMLNNIDTYYRYIRETKNTRAEIDRVEAQAQQERVREEAARQRLGGLDLVRLDNQTHFVNEKLAERAFSWSGLLDELESVLADDVRLISVAPSFKSDGTISLALQFASKSSDGMITTINRMNRDPRFANTFPKSENTLADGIQFDLMTQYIPQGPRVAIVRSNAGQTGVRR